MLKLIYAHKLLKKLDGKDSKNVKCFINRFLTYES